MCKCESTAETSFDRLSWEVVEEELEADWLAMLTPLPSRCVFDNDAKASGGRWRGYADRPKRHAATATDHYSATPPPTAVCRLSVSHEPPSAALHRYADEYPDYAPAWRLVTVLEVVPGLSRETRASLQWARATSPGQLSTCEQHHAQLTVSYAMQLLAQRRWQAWNMQRTTCN
jgi:hypothetical protein